MQPPHNDITAPDITLSSRQAELLEHANLLSTITQPLSSNHSPTSYTYTDTYADTYADIIQPIHHHPPIHRPPSTTPLSPVPHPSLTAAISAYLSQKSVPETTLSTGEALLIAADLRPERTLRRRLRAFASAAPSLGLVPDDIPREEDVRLGRCWPRVLCAVGHAAKKTDPDGWDAAAGREFGRWMEETLDEGSEGDDVVRRMVALHGGGFTLVVAGSQGSGKSATMGTVLGRLGLGMSHALSFWPRTVDEDGEEGESLGKLRRLAAVSWPHAPVVLDAAYGSAEVGRVYVKVGGEVVRVVELPSMERVVESVDASGARMEMVLGEFDEVVTEVQRDLGEYFVVVERMDDVDEERFGRVLRRVMRIYGREVLRRLVVVLTHGGALAPKGMSYAVWRFDRVRVVREVLKKVGREEVAVVVVENGLQDGREVLPDGTRFVDDFLTAFAQIVARSSGALAPIGEKRWWENYVLVAAFAYLVKRLT